MLDKQFPPAQPRDYTIRHGDPGQEPTMTPELKQFDSSARTWLRGAGFHRELWNSLITAVSRVAQTTKGFSAEQLDDYGAREYAKLQRAYGATLEDKYNAAGRMVEDLERQQPGLKNLLRSKGIGDNALVTSMLIQ